MIEDFKTMGRTVLDRNGYFKTEDPSERRRAFLSLLTLMPAPRKDGMTREQFDAVFIFIGADPRTQLVPFAETDESGYLVTNELMMSTSTPGLFAVGDVRNTPFRQVVTAASDGSIAAHAAAEYIDELKGQAYV